MTEKIMDRISIFEEYRLIEKSESEINGAWKGAHILLFFLAFVFGSFCTFCFHMLMYLFDEQCVLFPKLLSLSTIRQNIVYEFIHPGKDLPVDFLSTQWVEKSACYLPTYVPLVSGIFGLVWTTIFLMCSTGNRTHTGLQRPWRVLPPVFIFSLAMGGLCIYSSAVTHSGLQDLCLKLGEITGSSTCSYTVNVATLAYERRIRGVYQATRLTIFTAWLHTACWLFSALLTLVRVFMAVDFQLVCVRAELRANIDKMLEKHEKQIRIISPDVWFQFEDDIDTSREVLSTSSTQLFYRNEDEDKISYTGNAVEMAHMSAPSNILYISKPTLEDKSELSLVPAEVSKLARISAYQSVPRDKKFIVKILYDLIENIDLPERILSKENVFNSITSSMKLSDKSQTISRQYGQEQIYSQSPVSVSVKKSHEYISTDLQEMDKITKEIKLILLEGLDRQLLTDLPMYHEIPIGSNKTTQANNETMNIKEELNSVKHHAHDNTANKDTALKQKKKSILKSIGIQTDKGKKRKASTRKVKISESKSVDGDEDQSSSTESIQDEDKETQTAPKEKQD